MYRTGRTSEDIRYAVNEIIQNELKDPRINGIISIIKVNMSKDMKVCRLFLSIFNSKNLDETFSILKNTEGYIRKEVAERLKIRYTPNIVFELDSSMEYGSKIDNILKNL